jgi:branched-chain amino acid transport system permease protein
MSLSQQQYLLFTAIYILLGWGIYLPFKIGQLTWAPIYAMAVGAYVAAYASTKWHWAFAATLVVGMVLGGLLVFLPSLGLRRAPTFATVVASLAIIIVVQVAIRNWKAVGGPAGLYGIPRLSYLVPVVYVLLLAIGVLIHRLDHSRLGRAADGLLVNPDVAASLGVNMSPMSLSLQTIAGILGGFAGVIYAYAVGSVFPDAFGANLVVLAAAPLFVGGTSTLWGVVIMAPILWGVPLILPSKISGWKDIFIGFILIVVLLIRPEGLITRSTLRWVERLGTGRRERRKEHIGPLDEGTH